MSKIVSEVKLVDGKYQGNVKISEMSLKGGDLPSGYETKMDVSISFDDVDPVGVVKYFCGGQSLRVMLQAKLRKERTAKLDLYAKEGLVTTYEWITEKADTRNVDPVRTANRALDNMSDEQKADVLVAQCGLDKATALQMVLANKK